MEDGHSSVHIAMDAYSDLDVMAAVFIGRDLQSFALEMNGVVFGDDTFVLLAENVIKTAAEPCDEGRAWSERISRSR